jgi:hypothetical protein
MIFAAIASGAQYLSEVYLAAKRAELGIKAAQ